MSSKDKKSGFQSLLEFPKESWKELKKVHSPSRKETIDYTMRVLFMVVVFSLFLGLVDFGLGALMKNLLA